MIKQEISKENFKKNAQLFWAKLNASEPKKIYTRLAAVLSYFSRQRKNKRKIKPELLKGLQGSDNRRGLYETVFIPKKRGGLRQIDKPVRVLKFVQFYLLEFLSSVFEIHKTAHAFSKGKGIKTHAFFHKNKKLIFTLDIKDFFPSISSARVYGMLLKYPFNASKPIAALLTNLLTYEGKLPQGAATSPFISNMICRKLDSRLYVWAIKNDIRYTRYADDLTFSTNKLTAFCESNISFIRKIIQDEGFEINEDKSRLLRYDQRQLVTGIVVNRKLNVKKEYIRDLRAILHNVQKSGWEIQTRRFARIFNTLDFDIEEKNIIGTSLVTNFSGKHYSESSYLSFVKIKNDKLNISNKKLNLKLFNLRKLNTHKHISYILDQLIKEILPLEIDLDFPAKIITKDDHEKRINPQISSISESNSSFTFVGNASYNQPVEGIATNDELDLSDGQNKSQVKSEETGLNKPSIDKEISIPYKKDVHDNDKPQNRNIDRLVSNFQRIIEGKIGFVGHIKGQDNKVYLKLKTDYDWIKSFGETNTPEVKTIRTSLYQADPDLQKKWTNRSIFKKRIKEADDNELNEILYEYEKRYIEFAWLNKTMNIEEKRKKAMDMYLSIVLDPKITGKFFGYFNDIDNFGGLIHRSNDDKSIVKLNSTENIFKGFNTLSLLRNPIPQLIKEYLKDYNQYLKLNNNDPCSDTNFWKDKVIPFRKKIRFEKGMEGCDLILELSTFIEEVKSRSPQKTINLNNKLPVFYTDTNSMLSSLKEITESMITNSKENTTIEIYIEFPADKDSIQQININIIDKNGIIEGKPDLKTLFHGKLRKAVIGLRGLADWTMSADFSDCCSYQFNVMNYQTEKLLQPIGGVRHLITIYN